MTRSPLTTMKAFLKRGIGSFKLLYDSVNGPVRQCQREVELKRELRAIRKIERSAAK